MNLSPSYEFQCDPKMQEENKIASSSFLDCRIQNKNSTAHFFKTKQIFFLFPKH
jgi:hypothetical protein